MLNIYKQLFTELNKTNCKYCLFKTEESIKDNLNGYKDVDLLIREKDIPKLKKIAKKINFLQCNNNYPLFFIARDISGKVAVLDVEIKIPIMKPVMYRKPIDWDKLITDTHIYDGVSVYYAPISWKAQQKTLKNPILDELFPNPLIKYSYITIGKIRHTIRRIISLAKRILQIPYYRCKEGQVLWGSDINSANEDYYKLTGRKVVVMKKNSIIRIFQKLKIAYLKKCGNLVLVKR